MPQRMADSIPREPALSATRAFLLALVRGASGLVNGDQ